MSVSNLTPSQKYLKYDSLTGHVLAPLLQKEFFEDHQGRPWAITNKTLIKGKNPPKLVVKGPADVVRLTFDISDFVETTLHYFPFPQGQESEVPKTLNVSVLFAIIATATGQHHLLPGFSSLIPCCMYFLFSFVYSTLQKILQQTVILHTPPVQGPSCFTPNQRQQDPEMSLTLNSTLTPNQRQQDPEML